MIYPTPSSIDNNIVVAHFSFRVSVLGGARTPGPTHGGIPGEHAAIPLLFKEVLGFRV